jgi:hypothetical protein
LKFRVNADVCCSSPDLDHAGLTSPVAGAAGGQRHRDSDASDAQQQASCDRKKPSRCPILEGKRASAQPSTVTRPYQTDV